MMSCIFKADRTTLVIETWHNASDLKNNGLIVDPREILSQVELTPTADTRHPFAGVI